MYVIPVVEAETQGRCVKVHSRSPRKKTFADGGTSPLSCLRVYTASDNKIKKRKRTKNNPDNK